jgi:site-specific DNA-methyltransferase (adenine-specific)
MDSRTIQLTEAALKHGNLNIRPCGREFFPPDVFGGPSKKTASGTPITLKVEGLPKPIETDIPTDKTGNPRWLFRERKWVKNFVHSHNLHPGDTITIARIDKRTYKINSNNHIPQVSENRPLSKDKIHCRHRRNNLEKWLNTIQCMDCVEAMKELPDNCIDLVVTSPPYDGIRKYKGFKYDLHATGQQIFRILKDGGIAVMVIQDQTKDFAKTLTSFRTIVDWCDNIGFRLFETVIYRKYGSEGAWWKNRFRVDHEYMPIFIKGSKPRYFDKEPLKVKSKHGGKVMTGSGSRRTDGATNETVTRMINKSKCRGTVWDYLMAGDKDPLKRKHPAPFPDKIPYDFIQCFCPPNGIVLDPFMGSGSTAVVAKKLRRNYIGFDICEEYCRIAQERIRKTEDFLFG